MSQNKSAQAIRRVMDGTQTFFHDLFKSDTKKMIKCIFNRDVDAVGGQVEEDLKHLDHQHIFHSHDSNGREQATCVAVGGHYHEIKMADDEGNRLVDKNGNPRVECGPPLRKIKVRQGKRMVTKVERIKYQMQDGKVVEDNHVHKFTYEKSQELSPDKIQQLKRQLGAAASTAFAGGIKDNTPAALNDKDGVTLGAAGPRDAQTGASTTSQLAGGKA